MNTGFRPKWYRFGNFSNKKYEMSPQKFESYVAQI